MKFQPVYRNPSAIAELYRLMQERSTEADQFVNISHRRLPAWPEHVAFVTSKPYHLWYLIEADDAIVGSVNVTMRNEIGIVLFHAHRGRGYGAQALYKMITEYQPLPAIASYRGDCFLANINPRNERSIRLFTAAGFQLLQHTYELKS